MLIVTSKSTVHGITCIPRLCALLTTSAVVIGTYPGVFGVALEGDPWTGETMVTPIEFAAATQSPLKLSSYMDMRISYTL